MIFNNRIVGVLLVAAVATVTATGCGTDGSGTSGSADGSEKPRVVTAFYPLQYATQRIAGEHVEVTSLTKPGVEPHALRLGPRDVGTVVEADLAIYLEGFQPSVDDAIAQAENGFDVGRFANLKKPSGEDVGHEGEGNGSDGHSHEGHSHEGHSHDHSRDSGAHAGESGQERAAADPHFWLDPTRYANVAREIANQLGTLDPDHAKVFDRRVSELVGDLEKLDRDMASGLSECRSTDLVVTHEAFGYLADRYGFEQHGISGLDPNSEPPPGTMKQLVDFVREHDVSTVYYETLVSDATARTIADEAGVDVAVLDPVAGLTDESEGDDYLEVMRSNLSTLRQGQGCA